MNSHLRVPLAAVVVTMLWGLMPLPARAQSDTPQVPDSPPVIVPGANPAQTVPGYADVQPSPGQPLLAGGGSQFTTAQPTTGNTAPPANTNQPSFGFGNVPPSAPATALTPPNIQQPTNPMQSNYVARPSYVTVVPRGNVGRPSYVTAVPLSAISPLGQYPGQPSYMTAVPHGNVVSPSYATAVPLSAISPAGQFPGQPSWATAQPGYNVSQPSSASIQRRGNLGQLPITIQNGPVFVVPGTFPRGSTGPYMPGVIPR
jgi:hypothetical protein